MAASSSLLSTTQIPTRFHTPITFRAQRRLQFSAANQQRRLNASRNFAASLAPGNSNNDDLDDETVAPRDDTQDTTANAANDAAATLLHLTANPDAGRILPWDFNGNKTGKLYNCSPPGITYPAGSRDKKVNDRFVSRMNMFLNRNFLVRSALSGVTPHPFSNYERLNQCWAATGSRRTNFNPEETFATLNEIKTNGHLAFFQELNELLWFGGILSYGNIMAEVYTFIYDWIKPVDLPEVEGLCEAHDGITFHKVITKSLQLVRPQHKQQIIDNWYDELDEVQLIMRPGGMAGYFAKVKTFKMKLKDAGETITDAYMIRRATKALHHKHTKLAEALATMRTLAGRSGQPTTFTNFQDFLTDTFDFEIPAKDKKEVLADVPANAANAGDPLKRRNPGENDDSPHKKRKRYTRKVFPKGSCDNHPEATDHTTKRCWITIRNQKGLPKGFQWCLFHDKGVHYEHLCKRHAPNFPPVPTSCPIVGAAATTTTITPEQLKDQLLALLAKTKTNGITVTRDNQQSFRTARNIPTNVATNGPPVDQIAQMIINLEPNLRDLLQQKLAQEGL